METTATIYLPIKSDSLAHYFSKALIIPSKYYANKPADIQNKFSDSILLSKNKWVQNTDCSIEVVLTDYEMKQLTNIGNDFYEYNNPIPISRIKNVFFLDQNQKNTTIWNINNGAAFVPEWLIKVEQKQNIDFVLYGEENIISDQKPTNDITDKIKRFDILLGGFAFMKIGGKSFMNFSENYFSTLSYFNKLIKEQVQKASIGTGFDFSDRFIGVFISKNETWSKWQPYIFKNIDTQDIEDIANKEGVKIEKKLGTLKIESIDKDSLLFDLAVIATYGDRKNKSIDDLVSNLKNGIIPEEKTEEIALLFGLNNGYSKFRNTYKSANIARDVKFKLDNRLDYYTIESIYQFVFNGVKDNSTFSYIDNWCPISNQKILTKGFEIYQILDTVVIAKKKRSLLEEFLQNYSQGIYVRAYKSIMGYLPPFAKSDEKEGILFFENSLNPIVSNTVQSFLSKVEKEQELEFQLKEKELLNFFETEKVNLKNEIKELKNQIGELRNNQIVREQTKVISKEISGMNGQEYKIPEPEKLGIVEEPQVNYGANYESMKFKDLTDIAIKEKGINKKDISSFKQTKEGYDGLIKLIKNTKTLL